MKPYEPFKYATEAGINFYLGPYQLCQQEDFKHIEGNPLLPFYNIYFICQRNRIGVQPDSMTVKENHLSFTFNVHDEDTQFQVPGGIASPEGMKILSMEAKYPYNYFTAKGEKENDDFNFLMKASHILDMSRDNILPNASFLDLEILYVGQTNRDSKAPIIDRLISHQTLQKIYSQTRPDKEVYLIFCMFIPDGFVESRGTVRVQKEYEEEDMKRLKSFMKSQLQLTKEQQTNITEAALIRYFQPKYNTIYKESFPDQKHTNYAECYKLDLNAVSIELDTDFYYFTDKIKTSKRHSSQFQLTTDEERRTLFDLSVGFDT